MKKRCIALLVAVACLLPMMAWAAETPAVAPEATQETKGLNGPVSDEVALSLLEAVFATEDVAQRIDLVLRAAKAAPANVEVLVSSAQLLYYFDETGQYAGQAEEMLKSALKLARGEDRIYAVQSYAEQLIFWDRPDEALALLGEAIAEFPENEQLRVSLATAQYYSGQRDAAVAALEELLEDSPRNLEAHRLRAAILLDECRYEEALEAYQQIETGWPEYLEGLYGQYLTYIASGDFEMGVRAIDLLLGVGGEEGLWLDRARIRLWNQHMPEQAMKEAEALIRVDDEWIDAYAVKLVAHIMLEEYNNAREVAQKVAGLDKNHGDLLYAIVDMNDGEWKAAETRLRGITKRTPQAYSAWKNVSTVRLEGMDDIDGAVEAMKKAFAITRGQGDMDLYAQLGHVYRRQGNLLEAARAFSAADAVTFDDPSPLYYLIMVCVDAGRAGDIHQVMAEMERRYPGWYETMLARVLVEDALGNADAALEAFAAFAEKFPFPAGNLTALEGVLKTAAGDAEGADQIKAELDAMDEPTVADVDTYAYALLLLGDLDGAEKALAEAEALMPEKTDENGRLVRDAEVSLLTTRAELALARGDLDGSIAAFAEAAAQGWPAYSLALHPRYAVLRETEGFAAIMESQPVIENDWDLTIAPAIPK